VIDNIPFRSEREPLLKTEPARTGAIAQKYDLGIIVSGSEYQFVAEVDLET